MTPKSFSYFVLWLVMAGVGCTLIILAGVHLYLSPSLPSVDSLRDIRLQTPLRIYSYEGALIGEIGEKRRTPVTYQNIPQAFIDALLSAEDAQFYSHNGVSIKGLMRASSQLLISGDIQGGGSTITMQVARNFFLSRKQEFKRKFNEILLALRIERELSKEQILELYVNVIFLGNRAYGIEAAANVYYGSTLHDLTLAQLAMIAGLPKAPSSMNPLANPARAIQRRDWILGRMFELGKIDEVTYQQALAEPLNAKYSGSNLELSAQYVAEMARKKAIEFFGADAYTEGYKVYTTIRTKEQSSAQKAVINGLLSYDQRHGFRGAEQQLPPPPTLLKLLEQQPTSPLDGSDETVANTVSNEQLLAASQDWQEALLKQLQQIPTYAQLYPAAVINVKETSVDVLLKDGTTTDLTWEQGLSQASPYISACRRGASPKQASDVLALGDIIRVRDVDGSWNLSQLPEVQGALVSLDAKDGAVIALVGGLDFNQSNFNRVTQAYRQPGSNFKPFIYTAALENGFTPATIINDAPIVFEDEQLEADWRPENSSGKFYGPTRLRKALYLSRNLVSIRVLRTMGVANALAKMDRFGFDSQALPHDLSVALGSFAMTPMEIVRGYATFANGGYQVIPYFIDRIENSKGEVVFRSERYTVCAECSLSEPSANEEEETDPEQEQTLTDVDKAVEVSAAEAPISDVVSADEQTHDEVTPSPRVIDPQVSYIMDSLLKDVVLRGTAVKAKQLNRSDIAGKTGTTNQATNAWFSGYGGGIVTTAWVGFDQVATLGSNEYGGTAALPIWIQYMQDALKEKPEAILPRPEGLVTTRINPVTGKRALPNDPNAIFEIFRADNVPPLDDSNSAANDPWNENGDVGTEDIF